MYKAITHPILTYGSLVWWTATKKKYIVDRKNRVPIFACLGITDAVRTITSKTLNTFDHYIMGTSASCCLKVEHGRARILNILPLVVSQQSDYIIPYTDFDEVFKINIPSRSEW